VVGADVVGGPVGAWDVACGALAASGPPLGAWESRLAMTDRQPTAPASATRQTAATASRARRAGEVRDPCRPIAATVAEPTVIFTRRFVARHAGRRLRPTVLIATSRSSSQHVGQVGAFVGGFVLDDEIREHAQR